MCDVNPARDLAVTEAGGEPVLRLKRLRGGAEFIAVEFSSEWGKL
jgi:hypothetical protein